MSLTRLNDTTTFEAPSVLAYGGAGVGKTEFGASYGDRTLFINIGAGIATLHNAGFKTRKGAVNPFVVTLTETYGTDGLFKDATLMDAVCDTIDNALAKNSADFDVIVIDDATALRRGAMNKALEFGSEVKNYKTLGNAKKHGVIIPEAGDYNIEMNLIAQFMAAYIDICKQAGKVFVVLAHERHIYSAPKKIGEEGSLIRVLPGFTGKTHPDSIANMFDEVYYFSVKKQGNKSLFQSTTIGSAVYNAKSRWEYPNGTTDITIPKVLEHIRVVQSGKAG